MRTDQRRGERRLDQAVLAELDLRVAHAVWTSSAKVRTSRSSPSTSTVNTVGRLTSIVSPSCTVAQLVRAVPVEHEPGPIAPTLTPEHLVGPDADVGEADEAAAVVGQLEREEAILVDRELEQVPGFGVEGAAGDRWPEPGKTHRATWAAQADGGSRSPSCTVRV